MSGHVHLLYAEPTLGATLQRQLHSAYFHVTSSGREPSPSAMLEAVERSQSEVVALVRGSDTELDTVRQLKHRFPRRPIVFLDPIQTPSSQRQALQNGADAALGLPLPAGELVGQLHIQIRQARKRMNPSENDPLAKVLGATPDTLSGAVLESESLRLDVRHEDPQLAHLLAAQLGKAGLVAEVQPIGLDGRPISADGLVIGALSRRGWTDVLALMARERGRDRTRHTLIVVAAPHVDLDIQTALVQADVQGIWHGSGPDLAFVALVESLIRVAHATNKSRDALAQSLDLAITDGLTGLNNRRFLTAHLPLRMQNTRQSGEALTFALLDLDGFKGLNDRHGHQAGDQFLINVASHVRHHLRETDLAVRMGGDEFALVLPRTTAKDGLAVVQRLIAAIAHIQHAGSDLESKERIGASAGIVTLDPSDWATTAESRLAQADARLYAAKEKGGNQIVDTAPS